MSSRDREHDFPVTSIGRTSGQRLQQTVFVQESHPLGLDSPLPPESSTFTQKYRAYTPRTRGTPSPAVGSSQTAVPPTITPGTLIHPPSPQHHQPAGGGDATTKLQLTSAKAEAQNIGLDTGGSSGPSIGWAMLEKIVSESETGEVWAEVWSAITTGKATVLLPLEPLSLTDKLTPEFFKDHIVFDASSSSSSKATPIVTLSGLRGTIHGNTITFTSTLHPTSPLFQALEDPSTRSSALHKLPPLPTSKSLHTGFPSFSITTSSTTLPLPPKLQAQKPPLPPRPSARPISTIGGLSTSSHPSGSASSQSRILNPFASLFGHRPSTPTQPPPPPPSISQPAIIGTPSPTTSIQSLESHSAQSHAAAAGGDPHAVMEVNIMIIQRKIVRRDVGKVMDKSVRREVKATLNSSTSNTSDGTMEVPKWVLHRVLEFCEPWFPFIRAPKTISSSKMGAVGAGTEKEKEEKEEWVVNPVEVEYFEDMVNFIQDFYGQLEDYLRVELLGDNGHGESPGQEQDENEKATVVTASSEIKIRGIIELVEKTICSLFYDRLFSQPQTDDSSHDSALSNRIAALNLLDLTLEHLDISVEEGSKSEVEDVVKNCGAKLCKLDSVHTPKEKARILVDAHQIVVDGLSRLPPVRFMSAEESKALREQQAALFVKDEINKGAAFDPNDPPSVVSTTTSPTPQAASASMTSTTATTEPTLIISEGSPLRGSSVSAQETAGAQLSPLSFTTTSGLPSISASEAISPVPKSSSTLPPLTASDVSTPDSSSKKSDNNKPTPVSSDVLLPTLIFSTVKSNPPHLVSNLLHLQRFRHRNAYSYPLDGVDGGGGGGGGGEESFCLINMLAVAEFLENVDLAGLGLGTAGITGVSASELSPIITRNSPQTPTTPTTGTSTLTPKSTPSGIEGLQFPGSPGPSFLRGKVEQQVDAIAGSANKVISGVVDSSFGILRSLLPQNQTQNHVGSVPSAISTDTSATATAVGGAVDGSMGIGVGTPSTTKQQGQGGFGLLKKEAGFSIASIAASIPSISRSNSKPQQGGEEGQQLVTVSRHGSIRSFRSGRAVDKNEDGESEEDEDEESEESEDEDEDEDTNDTVETGSEEEGGDSDQEDRYAGEMPIPGIQVDSPYQHSHPHPYADSSFSVAKHASASAGSFGTDTRSIRSFESMLSDSKKRQKEKKLKKLAEDNEKEKRKAEKRMGARDKEKTKEKTKGGKNVKNVSVSADKASRVPRKSLTDRLASVGALAGGVKDSRRSSLLPLAAPIPIIPESSSSRNRQLSVHTRQSESPFSSRAASPSLPLSRSPSPFPSQQTDAVLPPLLDSQISNTNPISVTRSASASATAASGIWLNDNDVKLLPPPKKRFMECNINELSIGEVGELLGEYRRLVEGVRELGRFATE